MSFTGRSRTIPAMQRPPRSDGDSIQSCLRSVRPCIRPIASATRARIRWGRHSVGGQGRGEGVGEAKGVGERGGGAQNASREVTCGARGPLGIAHNGRAARSLPGT